MNDVESSVDICFIRFTVWSVGKIVPSPLQYDVEC